MNDLLRELAPISEKAWHEIEFEAKRTLKATLAARKLVDFVGPLGWDASAVGLGRVKALKKPPVEGTEANLREAQPLVELRVPFELARSELEAFGRGARDPDLDVIISACRDAAIAEDKAIFHGYPEGGIRGIFERAEHTLGISDDYEAYPGVVAEATNRLREAGVGPPYAIALGPRCYTGLAKTISRGGYPVIQHVRRILDGPIVWAPAVDGAAVLSLRGGDFELTVGQDLSIGYLEHSAKTIRLYLQESFTFLVLSPEAAVPLAYEK
ncbi:MAG: bacteriocin [Gammaproteobacteria bacterium]|nr:bacteriocin [Gammaproteobacteria bacterium]